MASTNAFDANCVFSSDFREIFPSIIDDNPAMWNQEETLIPNSFGNIAGAGAEYLVPTLETDTLSSSVYGAPFSDRLLLEAPTVNNVANNGQSVMMMTNMPDHQFDMIGVNGVQDSSISFGSDHQFQLQPEAYHNELRTSSTHHDYFQPFYNAALSDAWRIQGRTTLLPNMEEPSVKVRRYSVEERKDRILKYLKKRNQRNFNKTIKYACRKTLADRRIRVRGRFARNNELGEESTMMTRKNHNNTINNQEEDHHEYYDACEVKDNNNNIIGEEWLQEAVTSIMYLPIFAG